MDKNSNMQEKKSRVMLWAAVIALAVFAALMTVATLVAGGAINEQNVRLENVYRRALFDMCDGVNNMEINLSKMLISGNADGENDKILSDTLAAATLAESSLSVLPVSMENSIATGKFLNQVADWCESYLANDGAERSAYDGNVRELYEAACKLNAELKRISALAQDGKLSHYDGFKLAFDFDVELGDMQNNSIHYPELIYDGPFSDSKKHSYKALDDLPEITEEDAVEIAKKVGMDGVTVLGIARGKTASYEMGGTFDGKDAHVSVSVKGGKILLFDVLPNFGAVTITPEAAVDSAVEKAKTFGYGTLTPVWKNCDGGIAYINLAPEENGIIYYTDLVKVKVDMTDGSVVGLEASGYCKSHCARAEKPTITPMTARARVSDKLTVLKTSVCVIPDGDDERLCYEIAGEYDGLTYFVYIDAESARQVNVLRVIDGDQGTLVM